MQGELPLAWLEPWRDFFGHHITSGGELRLEAMQKGEKGGLDSTQRRLGEVGVRVTKPGLFRVGGDHRW